MQTPRDDPWDELVEAIAVESEAAVLQGRIAFAVETRDERLPIALTPADAARLARVLIEALERFRTQR
ncbi:hypothetical protein GXW71_08675 [Roseomonas hellenica]|uniref:Uncharacterized protein n=1 Tax=Plastoroseomonas hellenica TaxID=2687306 RepID=A0ABS5EVV7_9PROT|nr:hypothetical protein [Plastoroseomonas hellenica]MBR0664427.1 hypothetical protein [Plastoroseomonas hellenica]